MPNSKRRRNKKKQKNKENDPPPIVEKEKKRLFGYYKCTECKKSWQSAYSWVGMGQECRDCLIMVKPHRQKELEKGRGVHQDKPHLIDLCEQCQTLGYSCAPPRRRRR